MVLLLLKSTFQEYLPFEKKITSIFVNNFSEGNFLFLEYKGIVYAGFVLYGLMIGASLILIPGVQLVSALLVRGFDGKQSAKVAV